MSFYTVADAVYEATRRARSRSGCYEIPSAEIALHFARLAERSFWRNLFDHIQQVKRPRPCAAEGCLCIVEPWLAYEIDDPHSPRALRLDLCRACAEAAASCE